MSSSWKNLYPDIIDFLSIEQRIERLCYGYIRIHYTQMVPNDLCQAVCHQFIGITGISIVSPTERQNLLIGQWKLRKIIKRLSNARGNGTSMISLIASTRAQPPISHIRGMLISEYSTASYIHSRVSRISVLSALTTAQQILKLYTKIPQNGLVLYCGTVITDKGKEKRLSMHFEPFKPIKKNLYLCDNKFHVDPLQKMLSCSPIFGFILIDRNECLYGILTGTDIQIKHTVTIELPRKYDRDCARFRSDKRCDYVHKCAALATQYFIRHDRSCVEGLVLAGVAGYKYELYESDLFDARLKLLVIKIIDISYGGKYGLNEAIYLSKYIYPLANQQSIEESKLLADYMRQIACGYKYCFGVKDTISALETGAIKILIVWDNIQMNRVTVLDSVTKEQQQLYLTNDEMRKNEMKLNIVEEIDFVEWLCNSYVYGVERMEIVTDKSNDGRQFVKGLGGIGGLLK